MELHVVQLIQAHDVDELGVPRGHDPHVVDRRPRARVAEADTVTVVSAVRDVAATAAERDERISPTRDETQRQHRDQDHPEPEATGRWLDHLGRG